MPSVGTNRSQDSILIPIAEAAGIRVQTELEITVKLRIAIFAACAGAFALAQTDRAQAQQGPHWYHAHQHGFNAVTGHSHRGKISTPRGRKIMENESPRPSNRKAGAGARKRSISDQGTVGGLISY